MTMTGLFVLLGLLVTTGPRTASAIEQFLSSTNALDSSQPEMDVLNDMVHRQFPYGPQPRCPLCDSSVYSYCSYKMLHDACCCLPSGPPGFGSMKPPQCFYEDCSLLYAKSCHEHALIKNCCCSNPY